MRVLREIEVRLAGWADMDTACRKGGVSAMQTTVHGARNVGGMCQHQLAELSASG